MSDVAELPRYRFRGSVEPSAEVSRPVKAYRNPPVASLNGAAAKTSATLDIFDVIDSFGGWWGVSAKDVDAALALVGDVDTLYVRLNSPGGEATEGVAIANLLRAHPAKVRATVYGIAASAASVIAVAGDSVSMAPGSTLMIHEPSGFAMGGGDDMRSAAQMLDTMCDAYASLYALKAGDGDWRGIMRAATWYTPESAVAAKLADRVGLDPQLPAGLPPVEEDDTDDPDVVVEIDIELNPAARAAARRFDLSMLPNAPAALAPTQTPAASADGPTETQERSVAVEFTDEQLNTMRQALGLPEDADAAAIVAAQAEALAEQADAPAAQTPPVASAVPEGSVVISKAKLDALTEQAEQGAQARAKQITDERNDLIEAAMSAGKISRSDDTRAVWEGEFARNFDAAKADLESLPARFPVGEPKGYAGDDGSTGGDAAFSDDEAGALSQLAGVSKEGLLA